MHGQVFLIKGLATSTAEWFDMASDVSNHPIRNFANKLTHLLKSPQSTMRIALVSIGMIMERI